VVTIGRVNVLMVFKSIRGSQSAIATTCVVGVRGWAAEQDHPAYIPRQCRQAGPVVSYALRGCSFWSGAAAVLGWASGQHR
jgi:hypothetical protein